jgi:hypothetical protein
MQKKETELASALKRIRSSSLPPPPPCSSRTRSGGSAVSHVSFAELSDEDCDANGLSMLNLPDSEGRASPAVRLWKGGGPRSTAHCVERTQYLIRLAAPAARNRPHLAGDAWLEKACMPRSSDPSCRHSATSYGRSSPGRLSRSSSAGESVTFSRTPSIVRSSEHAPHRMVSLLFDDSVPSAVSVGISSDVKAPMVSSKKLAILTSLKVPTFMQSYQ